jgi:hypothetical protein
MIAFTDEDLNRFLTEDDSAPIVMLNLLRFRPDGGRERYFEYLNLAGPWSRATAQRSSSPAMAQRRWRLSLARPGTRSLLSDTRRGAPSRT